MVFELWQRTALDGPELMITRPYHVLSVNRPLSTSRVAARPGKTFLSRVSRIVLHSHSHNIGSPRDLATSLGRSDYQ